MVFNTSKTVTMEQMLKLMANEAGLSGEVIVIEMIHESTDNIILETSINGDDLWFPRKRKEPVRYIMINDSIGGGHHGRMKVTKRGVTVFNNKRDYISLYVSDEKNGVVNVEGKIPKDMSGSELEYIKQFCLRHNNLIQLAQDNSILQYVEQALKDDETRYNTGVNYIRHKNGDLSIFDTDIERRYNLKGDPIR